MSCVVGLLYCVLCIVFFFFKQKTAYEMRISDWSSDVCSSDLRIDRLLAAAADSGRDADWQARLLMLLPHDPAIWDRAEKIGRTDYYWRTCDANLWIEIGRASCRERVCQYV